MSGAKFDTTTCCASVRAGTDGWRTRYKPCSRKASVERDGKWYCGQHDPQAVADRRKTKESQWETEYQERQARYRLEAAAPELLALLIESQESIGGDWRARRDAAIEKVSGVQNVKAA